MEFVTFMKMTHAVQVIFFMTECSYFLRSHNGLILCLVAEITFHMLSHIWLCCSKSQFLACDTTIRSEHLCNNFIEEGTFLSSEAQ